MKSFAAFALVALAASVTANKHSLATPSSSNSLDISDYDPIDDYGAVADGFEDGIGDEDSESWDEVFDDTSGDEDESLESFFLADVAVERGQRGETLRSCLDNCDRLRRRSTLSAREQCQRDCHLRFAPTPSPQPAKCTRTRNGRETFFRGGRRFDLHLVRTHAQCTDRSHNLYQWGQFNGVRTFEDCASRCVNRPSQSVVNSNSFRGVDFDCDTQQCRCLYDRGFLNTRSNRRRFARTNRNERGSGRIAGGRTNNRNFFLCGRINSRRTRADESMAME